MRLERVETGHRVGDDHRRGAPLRVRIERHNDNRHGQNADRDKRELN